MKKNMGFTLIELLIVVAIIGILAAIAIPNFLQAQTRAKISKGQAELRTLATGLETYVVDQGVYPFDWDSRGWPWYITDVMTTPVNYVSAASGLNDPFRANLGHPDTRRYRFINVTANECPNPWPPCPLPGTYPSRWFSSCLNDAQAALARSNFGEWKLSCAGPDGTASANFATIGLVYDPTNGTISDGDIMRSQKYSDMTVR